MSTDLVAKYPDVDPFLLTKWERIFNAFFDRNASHEVDWGDFYLVARKVRDIYGADSDQMKYARSSMKALWDGLVKIADRNKDDIISIDEWVQLLKGCDPKDPKSEPHWFNEYLTFMFKLFDVSADDELDVAEYVDGMLSYGFSEEEARMAFKKFSVDKKGKPLRGINFFTFKQYWHDYFFTLDKAAVGNWIFGPILMTG